jgi:hypothetical protein
MSEIAALIKKKNLSWDPFALLPYEVTWKMPFMRNGLANNNKSP